MEQRLGKEVTRMRAQLMSFSNDGIDFNLSVPDTQEVKEVCSMFVTTITQQQKQLTTLQSTMAQMADDHVKSQEALIAWTTHCVNELMAQNAAVTARLDDARQQLKTMSYNMQGYADEVDTAPPVPLVIDFRPPGIYKTTTPKVITDPQEVGDGLSGTLFPTETGAPPESSLNVNDNPRWGGPIAATVAERPWTSPTKPSKYKNEFQKEQARRYYNSVKPFALPKSAAGRWRWAIRKVLRGLRTKKDKVGLTRGKVDLNKTVAERLERIETDIFTIPIELKKYVNKETATLNKRISEEVSKIEDELAEQKKETAAMCAALQTNIDTVSAHVVDVDTRLAELKEVVDNASKQAEEMEQKINKVTSRVGEHETSLWDGISGRVEELFAGVEGLKTYAETVTTSIARLAVEAELAANAVANPDESERVAEEGRKLFEMLEFDTQLRSTRVAINALDTNAFAVGDTLRGLRREILSRSLLTGDDQPVPVETANMMLASCDQIAADLASIGEIIQSANGLWKGHDESLASRWQVLSGVADAVKAVASMTKTLEDIRTTMDTLPTVEVVQEMGEKISSEAVSAAMITVDGKIGEVEGSIRTLTTDIKSVGEDAKAAGEAAAIAMAAANKKAAVVAASSGGGSDFNAGDLEAQLEPMIREIVEMYVGGSGGGAPTSAPRQSPTQWNSSMEKPPSQPDLEMDYLSHEIELANQNAPDMVDDDTINEEILTGSTVKILSGDCKGMRGVVIKVITQPLQQPLQQPVQSVTFAPAKPKGDEGEEQIDAEIEGGEETSSEEKGGEDVIAADDSEAAAADEEVALVLQEAEINPSRPISAMAPPTSIQQAKYRVRVIPAEAPVFPVRDMNSLLEGSTDSMEETRVVGGENLFASGDGGSNVTFDMAAVYREISLLSNKIEDLVSSRDGGTSYSAPPTSGAGPRSTRMTSHEVDRLMDNNVLEMIKNSLTSVSAEVGDLKDLQGKELARVKQQMKKAIITAIKRAITDKDAEDKVSLLTTKQLCIGCGRPSFVRKEPSSQSAPSNAFIPALNGQGTAGPDVYRSGFKMPVHIKSSGSRQEDPAFNEDSLFDLDDEEELGNRSISTYSEILAGMTGVTNTTNVGPGGIAISISPCLSPVRINTVAKNIRHAQGREETAMLRPIHRKGLPGKTSERARAAYAPERFDLPNDLMTSKSASSLMTRQSQQQFEATNLLSGQPAPLSVKIPSSASSFHA